MKLRFCRNEKRRFCQRERQGKSLLEGKQRLLKLGRQFACFQENVRIVFSGHFGGLKCKTLICFKILCRINKCKLRKMILNKVNCEQIVAQRRIFDIISWLECYSQSKHQILLYDWFEHSKNWITNEMMIIYSPYHLFIQFLKRQVDEFNHLNHGKMASFRIKKQLNQFKEIRNSSCKILKRLFRSETLLNYSSNHILLYLLMFRRFADKIRESQSKFLFGLFGAVTLTGLAYLAYRNFSRKTHNSHIEAPSEHDLEQLNPPLQEPQLNPANEQLTKNLIRVVNNVKNAAKNSQDFAYEAVKAIYEGYHDLSSSEFKRLALESRRLRRQNMSNLQVYRQILVSYQKQIDEARTKSLKSILEFFKLDMREWLVLAEKYSEECKEEWDQVMILTDVKQLSGLRQPEANPIHPEIMIQIFQYKIQVFDEVLHAAAQLFSQRNSSQLYSFIDRRLSDLVFLKYGTEDEDIFFSMVIINPSTKQKIEELQQQVNARLEFFMANSGK